MLRKMLKSKIHGATVTETALHYEGSITLDRDLVDAANLLPGEMVLVVNLNNGARLETYVIEGERGSGVVCLNGPAARLAQVGDVVHVISWVYLEDAAAQAYRPVTVKVDARNRLVGQ
ncbi:MAG: aspartate 1-decarboxylase [Armatimonadetes bacterium]|nr:aspartate 1-decarboxylase [Armatimonadota bacterium]